MCRNAVGKLEKPGKPFLLLLLLLAEPLDVSPPLTPADCPAQRDDDHVNQQMELRPFHPWVGQGLEVKKNTGVVEVFMSRPP